MVNRERSMYVYIMADHQGGRNTDEHTRMGTKREEARCFDCDFLLCIPQPPTIKREVWAKSGDLEIGGGGNEHLSRQTNNNRRWKEEAAS